MPSVFLSFSEQSLKIIINFLDVESRIQMREVCKNAKAIIDHENSKIKITQLKVHKQNNIGHRFSFLMEKGLYFTLWKAYVDLALSKLKTANPVVEKRIGGNAMLFTVAIEEEKVEIFICFLMPVLHRVQFQHLAFETVQPEIIRICSMFLEGKSVELIHISLDGAEGLTLLFNLINTVNQLNHIDCRLQTLDNGGVNFLLQCSEIVKSISMSFKTKIENKIDIMSIIESMFGRNCERLSMYPYGGFQNNFLTLEDIERLFQTFHHMPKKFNFRGYTNTALVNAKIGAYKVFLYNANNFEINHMDSD